MAAAANDKHGLQSEHQREGVCVCVCECVCVCVCVEGGGGCCRKKDKQEKADRSYVYVTLICPVAVGRMHAGTDSASAVTGRRSAKQEFIPFPCGF